MRSSACCPDSAAVCPAGSFRHYRRATIINYLKEKRPAPPVNPILPLAAAMSSHSNVEVNRCVELLPELIDGSGFSCWSN